MDMIAAVPPDYNAAIMNLFERDYIDFDGAVFDIALVSDAHASGDQYPRVGTLEASRPSRMATEVYFTLHCQVGVRKCIFST